MFDSILLLHKLVAGTKLCKKKKRGDESHTGYIRMFWKNPFTRVEEAADLRARTETNYNNDSDISFIYYYLTSGKRWMNTYV